MFEVLIRGGRVLDGSGSAWFHADVGLDQGRIVAVGRNLPGPAGLEVDAAGLMVAPGFIDMHSHSDLRRLAEPACPDKISQGITTELLGQDGSSVAPVTPDQAPARRRYLAGLLGNPPVDWEWPTFNAYLQALERTPAAPNACTLVTHGAVRSYVMGMNSRPATSDEIARMCELVAEAMEAGAFGLSTGLIYVPCCWAAPDELAALYRVCAERGGILVSHVRNEADLVLEATEEMVDIGRQTGVPVHISHLKAIGPDNWSRMEPMLEGFAHTCGQGLDVTYDHYPYIAGSTILGAVLPAWAHEGGPDLLLARLRDDAQRRRMRQDIGEGLPGWENLARACGWEGIIVSGVATQANKTAEGKSVQQLADELAKDPLDVVADLLLAEDLEVAMLTMHGDEEVVKAALRFPLHMVGTDGVWSGRPNPRLFGTYPRILGRYVREEKVLELREAVRRMTGAPAARLGLKDRGLIKEGFAADVTLFDPDRIIDRSTFADPWQLAEGIEWVFVNGQPALARGAQTDVRAGQVIRRR